MGNELIFEMSEENIIFEISEEEPEIIVEITEVSGPSNVVDLSEYMKKSTYDVDEDNVVDQAEKLDGGVW
jgi:hypothetical protein